MPAPDNSHQAIIRNLRKSGCSVVREHYSRAVGETADDLLRLYNQIYPSYQLENLIQAGAFDCFGLSRRELIWELGKVRQVDEMELDYDDDVSFPKLSRLDSLNMEYAALGLSTEDHIMAILRPSLQAQGILNS